MLILVTYTVNNNCTYCHADPRPSTPDWDDTATPPTALVCLTCHGADIEPDLKAEIDRIYPNDQAIGFTLGELRGAFTITKTSQD